MFDRSLTHGTQTFDAIVHTEPECGQETWIEAFTARSSEPNEVLCIYELAVMIMLQLPPIDIVRTASRVTRYWSDIIRNSVLIQRKLMVRPSSAGVAKPYGFADNCCNIPLYDEALELNRALELLPDSMERPTLTPYGISVEPGLNHIFQTSGKKLVRVSRQASIDLDISGVHGSWRQMYLSDPPISTAKVSIDLISSSGSVLSSSSGNVLSKVVAQTTFSIRDNEGITLGLIEDLVQDVLAVTQEYPEVGEARRKLKVEACVDFFVPAGGVDTW
ncbi:hypothetical protein LTR37_002051 [Vermiconidia calcicola]|uniref:Uncharacterized protein n=1 Tax=Vermiconidia calcicola TaxID=1690605 RepID=A0ACC3NTX0_9PEZI|nr:hypothetical protein LTR37_002051 [Vermiconidia calcicola]